jgi:hypothetical protein
MDLTLERWNAMTDAERHAAAERLARQLPSGFTSRGFLGRVAQFERDGATFSLVPGGAVQLGFDLERWAPADEERESWEGTQEEYGAPPLHEHFAAVLQRPRTVKLGPLLVETRASDAGWVTLRLDDPRVLETQRQLGPPGASNTHTLVNGDGQLELSYQEGRVVRARASVAATHSNIAESLARDGFRLPSSDEWEHACGAGASTLFRWGDHVPCDRYPDDVSREEMEWKRQWALSAGRLERPPGGFVPDFDHHRQPNAFGLFIASNPYQSELVAEPGHSRGGDGGSAICGGAGFLMGWLPLATAWLDPDFCMHDPAEPVQPGYTVTRRVLPLG